MRRFSLVLTCRVAVLTCCSYLLAPAQWVYGPDLCYTPLHFAVTNALPDIMRVLFKYNCDVLLRTPAGEIAKVITAEHCACA